MLCALLLSGVLLGLSSISTNTVRVEYSPNVLYCAAHRAIPYKRTSSLTPTKACPFTKGVTFLPVHLERSKSLLATRNDLQRKSKHILRYLILRQSSFRSEELWTFAFHKCLSSVQNGIHKRPLLTRTHYPSSFIKPLHRLHSAFGGTRCKHVSDARNNRELFSTSGTSVIPDEVELGRAALPLHLRDKYQANIHLVERRHPVAIVRRVLLDSLASLKPPVSDGFLYSPPTNNVPSDPPAEESAISRVQCAVRKACSVSATLPPDLCGRDAAKGQVFVWDSLSPVVDTETNFGALCIPEGHPARTAADTFIVEKSRVLRTHTTAHIPQSLRWAVEFQKADRREIVPHDAAACPLTVAVCGEVYRRDTVCSSHFPIFHQLDIARIPQMGVNAETDFKRVRHAHV